MSKLPTVLFVALLLAPVSRAHAVPIAAGERSLAFTFPLHHEFFGPLPSDLVMSVTQTSSTTAVRTSGSGEAFADADVSPDGIIVGAFASVPGPAGRAVAEATAEGFLTLTNAGSEPFLIWASVEEFVLPFGASLPMDRGPGVVVNDPRRERAHWFSSSLIADSACFESAQPHECAIDSFDLGFTVGGEEIGARPIAPEDEIVDGVLPDFAFISLRNGAFDGTLAPGESISFGMRLSVIAEAVRVPEPVPLAVILAGLAGIGLMGNRRRLGWSLSERLRMAPTVLHRIQELSCSLALRA